MTVLLQSLQNLNVVQLMLATDGQGVSKRQVPRPVSPYTPHLLIHATIVGGLLRSQSRVTGQLRFCLTRLPNRVWASRGLR